MQNLDYNSIAINKLQSRAIAGLKVCEENKQDYRKSLCYSIAIGILLGGTIVGTLALLPEIIIPVSLSAVGILATAVYKCVKGRKLWQQSLLFEQVFKDIQQKRYAIPLDNIKKIIEGQNSIDTRDQNKYRNELAKRFSTIFICKSKILENNFTDGWHQNCLGLLYCAAVRQIRLNSNFNSSPDELARLKSMVLDCGYLRTELRNFPCKLDDLVDHILHGPREPTE